MVESIWVTEMTDPKFYYSRIVPILDKGEPVVIYTKGRVPERILGYDNLAISITITGWGGTWLEPGVPVPTEMIRHLNEIIEKFKGTQRLRLRIDPVVPTFEGIARASTVSMYVKEPINIVTSIIQIYKGQEEVARRLGIKMDLYTVKSGRALFPRKEVAERWLTALYKSNASLIGRVQFCGMPYNIPGAIHTGCIDKSLLESIGVKDFKPAIGNRPSCKCVIKKRQIVQGKCKHGCTYCYAHKENLKGIN